MPCNVRRLNKIKDPIYEAVLRALTRSGKGFWIVTTGPWIHPINKVRNCYAILFDGFVQYKFSHVFHNNRCCYRVAEIRSQSMGLPIKVGQYYSQEKLIEMINKCVVR